MSAIAWNPLHRSLRGDPRWPVLMKKMGFVNAAADRQAKPVTR